MWDSLLMIEAMPGRYPTGPARFGKPARAGSAVAEAPLPTDSVSLGQGSLQNSHPVQAQAQTPVQSKGAALPARETNAPVTLVME